MKREEIRAKILPHAMELAVFEGWNDALLDKATRAAGFDDVLHGQRVFPHGAQDVLDAYSDHINQQLIDAQAAHQESFHALKLRDKMVWLLRTRLELQAPHKEALRRAAGSALIPTHTLDASSRLWRAVDTCWHIVGDTSVDMNYYTKRLTLAQVYVATLAYWFHDTSEQHFDTYAFLERRMANVMAFHAWKAKATKNISHLLSPLKHFKRSA